MNIIETHRLSRRFGSLEALHELTLAVPEGSVCALLGPNGAGKTTTLKLLMNLLRPTAGEAQVLGVDSRKLGERELTQIGYVSENQEQPLWMTVRRFLDYCRPFYPAWDVALERTLLERFDLPEDRKLGQLSRGMLMKAALLSSLAYRPRLLVLDEPFSGLDPLVREELSGGLLEVAAGGGCSVLISSHDIEEVERLADRIAVLEAGQLTLAEPTDALLARFRRIEVALAGGSARLDAPPPDWIEVERKDGRVRFVDAAFEAAATERACRERFPEAEVTVHPMTLREVFVALARRRRRPQEEEVR